MLKVVTYFPQMIREINCCTYHQLAAQKKPEKKTQDFTEKVLSYFALNSLRSHLTVVNSTSDIEFW